MTNTVVENIKIMASLHNGPDGNYAQSSQTFKETEDALMEGITALMKPEDFVHDISVEHGKLWVPHCFFPLGSFEQSYRNLNLPADCNHLGIIFQMKYNLNNFKAKITRTLTPIYAYGVFQDSGSFCGFTPDSLASPALAEFCCNLYVRGK